MDQRNSSDDESLDAQLDRLNQTIESMMHPLSQAKRRSTPSHSISSRKHRTTYSYEPLSTFEDEQSDSCSRDDNFFSQVESLAVDYERASMINEDFRSHELNSSPNIIECTPLQVYNLSKDIARLVCLMESGLTSLFCLSIANFNIQIKVKDSFGSKDDAIDSFLRLSHKAKLKHDMNRALNKTWKDKENSQFVYLKKCKDAVAVKSRICSIVKQELSEQRHQFERALEEFVNGEPLVTGMLYSSAVKKEETDKYTGDKEEIDEYTDNKEEIGEHTNNKEEIGEYTNNKEEIVEYTNNKEEIVEYTDNKEEIVEYTDNKEEIVKSEEMKELPELMCFVKEYSRELSEREASLDKEQAEVERRNREVILKLANVYAKEKEVVQERKLLEKRKLSFEKKLHMFENNASNLLQCVQVFMP